MRLFIDKVSYQVKENFTIYQFCFSKGITLPCFCYHEKLSIAGNCRACIVEVNGNLGVACSLPILDNMQIFTDNKRVRKARSAILEFLLINHPLDCPICDQGGECDLQDIALTFGSDRGRFYENYKRAVNNLNCCGPFIKTVMTRCIHCTRCVRFIAEVSGTFNLGTLNRGNKMEIGTYIENFLGDELSGNIIDLCPVGALTSMPFAFNARSWEFKTLGSLDIMDALGSEIFVDVAGNRIRRILPSGNSSAFDSWLTNKARFSYESYGVQRLNYPLVKYQGKLIKVSWLAIFTVFTFLWYSWSFENLQAVTGPFMDLHGVLSVKLFLNTMGSSNIITDDPSYTTNDWRHNYLIDGSLNQLRKSASILFIATDPRSECPMLNSNLRDHSKRQSNFKTFYSLGLSLNYSTFPVTNFGSSTKTYKKFMSAKFKSTRNYILESLFSSASLFVQKPTSNFIMYAGMGFAARVDAPALLYASRRFFLAQRSYAQGRLDIISTYLGRLSVLELNGSGKSRVISKRPSLVFACATDKIQQIKNAFVVCLSYFINSGANSDLVDIFLPVGLPAETQGMFLNLEGKLRTHSRVISPYRFVSHALELMGLLLICRLRAQTSNFSSVPNFYSVLKYFRQLLVYENFLSSITQSQGRLDFFGLSSTDDKPLSLSANPNFPPVSKNSRVTFASSLFRRAVNNYYATDMLTKNSQSLARCAVNTHKLNFNQFI